MHQGVVWMIRNTQNRCSRIQNLSWARGISGLVESADAIFSSVIALDGWPSYKSDSLYTHIPFAEGQKLKLDRPFFIASETITCLECYLLTTLGGGSGKPLGEESLPTPGLERRIALILSIEIGIESLSSM